MGLATKNDQSRKIYGTFNSNEFNVKDPSEQMVHDGGTQKHFDFDNFLISNNLELGSYQLFVVCLLIIPGCFLSAYNTLDIVFMSYTPKFKCDDINANTSMYASVTSSSSGHPSDDYVTRASMVLIN